MPEIILSTGPIDYTDTGGAGPTVVLLHGLLMDGSLWDDPVAALSADHRCVVPTLPLGAHRLPQRADADLSLPALAALVTELLDRLDLRDVTLVGNDTGGALAQLVVTGGAAGRVGRVVLVSCDAYDNFPPGLTGTVLVRSGALPPGLFRLFMRQVRIGVLRRSPIAFGWLTKRGDEAAARWVRQLTDHPAIARDLVRVLRAADGRDIAAASAALSGFDRPALVVWAAEDRVMPPEHGRRLAAAFPDGRLVEVADSYTLVPLDQPDELAAAIGAFVNDTRHSQAL
jgi:pimeloyl-ACP methyl ester carboxylesterase